MTGPRDAPLAPLAADAVENVYVFVCDSLRWDAAPERVTSGGVTCRTVANALLTPQSIPTMLSGRFPPRHGVTWFHESMAPALDTVFDVEGVDAAFVETEWDRPLDTVLNGPPDGDLRSLDTPFVCVEHDHGGHVPYPHLDAEDASETFRTFSHRPNRLRNAYEASVARSVDRFERRLDALASRGLLEETLVVFTSDHGELLGEHGGFVGHGYPPLPELAYVPTTFIHPSLNSRTYTSRLVQHVDLLPTIRDVLRRQPPNDHDAYDGVTLCDTIPSDRLAYTNGVVRAPERWRDSVLDPIYDAPSVWDPSGGYVFARTTLPKRVFTGIYQSTQSGYTGAYNSSRNVVATLGAVLPKYLSRTRRYGEPTVEEGPAREFCFDVASTNVESETHEISEDTRETLENLGYV